ncbi:MAG: ABC transporter permease [Oscillospiraceae bacterium]
MAFLYMPIAVLIVFSFNQSKSRAYWTGFTLNWYKELFSNELIISSLWNTLIIAFLSSLIATVIGTAAAIGLSRMNKWVRGIVLNITYMPMINPDIITGVSMMLLFGLFQALVAWMGGLFGTSWSFESGFWTLLLAHITFNIPYVILNVRPKLRQMDPSIYEAARDLGCNEWQAIRKVVLPDIMPGIVAGFLTSITMSLDDFVISYFVTGASFQTLPITIFSMTRRKVSPEINALSTIIFVVVLVVLVLVNISDSRKEKRQLAGRRVRV